MNVFQWNKVFSLLLRVLHQIVSNFWIHNCFKTSEIKNWRKPFPTSRKHWSELNNRWSPVKQSICVLFIYVTQIPSTFYKHNLVKTSNSSMLCHLGYFLKWSFCFPALQEFWTRTNQNTTTQDSHLAQQTKKKSGRSGQLNFWRTIAQAVHYRGLTFPFAKLYYCATWTENETQSARNRT